jgi:hypothetical protein
MVRLGAGYRYIREDRAPLKVATDKIEALKRSFGTPYDDWIRIEYGAMAPQSPE